MRGNRRWVLLGSVMGGPGGQLGSVHHWVPRSVPGKRTVTACGIELPRSFAVFWGGKEPRCAACVVARGVKPL